MKSKIILIAIVVGAGLLFLSAGTLLTNRNSVGLADKRTNLALRAIGHQLMLQAGNSRSRVLPVKQIDPFTYQLEFRSAFSFTPDSLVKLVQQKLKEVDSSSHYFVMVLSCNDPTEIIYGYEFSEKKNMTIPCLGREQRVGCYMIQIVFPDKKENKSSANYIWMITLSMMALIGFVGGRYIQKEKKIPSIVPEEFLTVGRYKFYHQRRVLKCHDESIELSDKEAQVLKILATHQNEIVERERLLKEVWEDDGVFVGRSLDVFISKLRKKLQDDSSLRIVSIHGKGYKLEA
jgi:hypothetical protein